MTRSVLLLLACLAAFWPLSASPEGVEVHPSDHVRALHVGSPEIWPDSIDALLDPKYPAPQAISTLVRRLDVMTPLQRRRFAKALRYRIYDAHGVEAALELLEDSDRETWTAALAAIGGSDPTVSVPVVMRRVRGHDRRGELANFLASSWVREEEERLGHSYRRVDLFRDIERRRTDELFPLLATLLRAPEPDVRRKAVNALARVGDWRVVNVLFPLTVDPDAGVRVDALIAVGRRGDERALDGLLRWARSEDPESRRWHRNRRFEKIGAVFFPTHLQEFFERYRRSRDEVERLDWTYAVDSAACVQLADFDDVVERMQSYVDDPDPYIASSAANVLRWHARKNRPEPGPGLSAAFLTVATVAAGLLGLVLFLWAFRLFKLRALFRHLPISRVRSMAVGQVALEGRVHPAGRGTRHPITREPCVYYPGIESGHGPVSFWLEDGTGRVAVDADGLVLLSEDGVLEPGEHVVLVGDARRASDGTLRVGKDRSARPLYSQLVHLAVRRFLGGAAKSGSARLLFSDPRRCFCVWEHASADARRSPRRPLSRPGDLAALVAAVASTGIWAVLLAAAALAMVDAEFSAYARETLEWLWSGGGSVSEPPAR